MIQASSELVSTSFLTLFAETLGGGNQEALSTFRQIMISKHQGHHLGILPSDYLLQDLAISLWK